jgi:hypothetical protein
MFRISHTLMALFAICAALLGLCACGGSGAAHSSPVTSNTATNSTVTSASDTANASRSDTGADLPAHVVARVGRASLTAATVSHWMKPMTGGDFYESSSVRAPAGLVSEPPDYASCVTALTAFGSRFTPAQMQEKCHQLYEGIKQQVLTYLIGAATSVGRDAELGISVSEHEVEQEFRRLEAANFPKAGQLQKYLADREWPLSVELFLIKHDLLFSKLERKLHAEGQAAFSKYLIDSIKRWTAKTSCRAGYVVNGCKQFTTAPEGPSPAVLIEEIVRSR